MQEFLERINSWLLERKIRRARIALCMAATTSEARLHADRMRDLIACRSARQVARMERQRGLA